MFTVVLKPRAPTAYPQMQSEQGEHLQSFQRLFCCSSFPERQLPGFRHRQENPHAGFAPCRICHNPNALTVGRTCRDGSPVFSESQLDHAGFQRLEGHGPPALIGVQGRADLTNLADATRFASENGINPERVETAMSQCVPLAQEWNIEGVCEVTPIIVFREFFQQNDAGEWESFYDFSCAKYGLKDVANGNLYHLHRKDGKVSLYDENRGLEIRLTDFYRANTPKDLMMEKTPNQIGTPTAKKIRAWFDYWDEYYKLYNTRLAECKESAQKAFEDIKGKCDKVERIKMDNYLGVPSKFIACKSPLIAGMVLNYAYGKYSKTVEVDWTKQAEFLGF